MVLRLIQDYFLCTSCLSGVSFAGPLTFQFPTYLGWVASTLVVVLVSANGMDGIQWKSWEKKNRIGCQLTLGTLTLEVRTHGLSED